ncbi:MAG: VCBS repeat-containing protein, partial [Bacteroidota bacterium]
MKQFLLFLLGFMGIQMIGMAQIYQANNTTLPTNLVSGATMDVESADLDGDGDLEVILALEFGANIILFNEDGNLAQDPTRLLPEWNPNDGIPGEDSEDIGIADFDEDGDLDLLFVSEDSPAHELLLNDGNGLFSFAPYQFPGSTANGIAILDIDGKQGMDVIIGNNGQNRLFLNNGDATFTEAANRWPVNSNQTQDLKVVDLDLDGDLDIVEGIELGGN